MCIRDSGGTCGARDLKRCQPGSPALASQCGGRVYREPLRGFEHGRHVPRTPQRTDLARELVGKRLLVGLTYLRYSGGLINQRQFHRIVERVGPAGILIRLPDGDEYLLRTCDLSSRRLAASTRCARQVKRWSIRTFSAPGLLLDRTHDRRLSRRVVRLTLAEAS